MSELKPCPFCGSTTAPSVMLLSDALFTDEGSPEFEWDSTHYVAVCDFNNGGCGANLICKDGGEKEASELWNRRIRNDTSTSR